MNLSPTDKNPAERLAEAFDHWLSLDRQLEAEGPQAVDVETMSAAWADLLQAHEDWSNSR